MKNPFRSLSQYFQKSNNRYLSLLSLTAILLSLLVIFQTNLGQKKATIKKAQEEMVLLTEPITDIVSLPPNLIKNSFFDKFSKENLPESWFVYQASSQLSPPELSKKESVQTFSGHNSFLFIKAEDKFVGVSQSLPDSLPYPLKASVNLLVTKGRVRFSLNEENGAEIYAGEAIPKNKWQEISFQIVSDKFADKQFKLKNLRIISADPGSEWYIAKVILSQFQSEKEEFLGEKESFSSSVTTPIARNVRTLFIGLNPVENGQNLVDFFGMGDGYHEIEEHEARINLTNDALVFTGGYLNYQFVRNLDLNSFPPYLNDFTYTFATFTPCAREPSQICETQKQQIDHIGWVRQNNICQIARETNTDAILLQSSAYVMAWETFMISSDSDKCFDVNGPCYIVPECVKPYIVYNAIYARDAHILHNYGHAVERIISYYIAPVWGIERENLYWNNFARMDLYRNQPGVIVGPFPETFCGNIHWPGNFRQSYDTWNPFQKTFNCQDWGNYPNFTGRTETHGCEKWGCSPYGWELYWLSSLPKSWWSFLAFPEDIVAYKTRSNQCYGQYFGQWQCKNRDLNQPWRKLAGSCQLNSQLGAINPNNQNDPINNWKWSYCLSVLITPTSTPTLTLTPTPTSASRPNRCYGQYFGQWQCKNRDLNQPWRKLAGSCQLNSQLGAINPNNLNDPINDWKWSYCPVR